MKIIQRISKKGKTDLPSLLFKLIGIFGKQIFGGVI